MTPKNIAILVVLLVGIWAVWNFSGPSDDAQESQQSPQEQNTSQDSGTGDNSNGVEEIPNALIGELKNSNDKRRGNLMLLLEDSDRIIYLNTSRDFSSLVGKKVEVSIEGSLDDFLLLDIIAK